MTRKAGASPLPVPDDIMASGAAAGFPAAVAARAAEERQVQEIGRLGQPDRNRKARQAASLPKSRRGPLPKHPLTNRLL